MPSRFWDTSISGLGGVFRSEKVGKPGSVWPVPIAGLPGRRCQSENLFTKRGSVFMPLGCAGLTEPGQLKTLL